MYEIFALLNQAGIAIHFLGLMIVTQLLLWNKKERQSTGSDVPFEPVKVSIGIEFYRKLRME